MTFIGRREVLPIGFSLKDYEVEGDDGDRTKDDIDLG